MAVDRLESVETGSGFEMRNIGVQSLSAHHFHWFHQLNAARNNAPRNLGATTLSRLAVWICFLVVDHVVLCTTQILCKSAHCPP